MKKSVLLLLAALLISISLSACSNAITDIGKHLKRTGEYVTNTMKEN